MGQKEGQRGVEGHGEETKNLSKVRFMGALPVLGFFDFSGNTNYLESFRLLL